MYEDRKKKAMIGWRDLLAQPEIRMTPEEQYDELLKMADAMESEGLVTGAEWRQLIRDAGAAFTHVREGLEGGPRVGKEKPELGEHVLKNHEGAERNL